MTTKRKKVYIRLRLSTISFIDNKDNEIVTFEHYHLWNKKYYKKLLNKIEKFVKKYGCN